MSCIKHEPSEDSDASTGKPARPPKPARLSPSRAPLVSPVSPLCEYVDVELKPPMRRPKPDLTPAKRPEHDISSRCKEYELMANFMSHAQTSDDDAPPAVPPRGNTVARVRLQAKPLDIDVTKSDEHVTFRHEKVSGSTTSLPEGTHSEDRRNQSEGTDVRPASKIDTISNDDSLLDELQRDTYCVLKVCEDEGSEPDSSEVKPDEPTDVKEKEEYGMFSRISLQRKSNPIKTQPSSMKPLKTSNSTSNVHDAGSHSRPFTERLTPFFLKKKSKPPEDAQASSKCSRKEDNLIGRLTPRFGQSRLYGRGQSLELAPEGRAKRIERSATSVNIPARPLNSSIVANLKFLTLHRYGAPDAAPGAGAEPDDDAWRRLLASGDIRL